MSDFGLVVTKVGLLWSEGRKVIIERQLVEGVDQAGRRFAEEVKRAAPVATGGLARSVQLVGRGVAKRVRMGLWQAIPVDQGHLTRFVSPRQLQKWVEVKGLATGSEARALAFKIARAQQGKKKRGKAFFYATWDRLQPLLWNQYLGPVGAQIVQAL